MSAPSHRLAACSHCGEQHGKNLLRCPSTDRPLELKGRLLAGKFRFLRRLGEGGMASVWLAINESLEREVAIKLLLTEVSKNQELLDRFSSEARATARIGSEYIVEVYDCGESPLGPYIVMEALVGQDLSELLDKRFCLPPEEIIPIMIDVLEGLGAAHYSGIVHRDLKPGNIFLHYPSAGRAHTKLMDFGVSKFLDGSGPVATRNGFVLGTLEYMAPEQLAGAGDIDARADIFAAGAVLYRALADAFVYTGETMPELLVSMANEEIRRLDELEPELPAALVEVVHRALERNPDDRYTSALDMANALREVLADLGSDLGSDDAPAAQESVPAAALPALQVAESLTSPRPNSGSGVFVAAALIGLLGMLGSWWVFAGSSQPRVAQLQPDPVEALAIVEDSSTTAKVPADQVGEESGEPGLVVEDAEETGGDAESGEESGETGLTEDLADTADADGPTKANPLRPEQPPKGTFLSGKLLTLSARASSNTHTGARQYCAGLSRNKHLGLKGWRLPNPSEARRLIGNKKVRSGTYWTSAIWKGKAISFKLPKGKKSSDRVDRKSARPLCVLTW